MNKRLAQKLKAFAEALQLWGMSVDDHIQAFGNSPEFRKLNEACKELLSELDNLPEPIQLPQPPAAP